MADGFVELIGKVCPLYRLYRHFLLAILRAFCRELAQHHFRMLNKVLIDAIAFRCRSKMHPIRFDQRRPVTLLEKQNVRHHACIGVPHKGIIGQADCTDQVCTVCKVPAHRFILFIHCAG